MSVHTSSKKRKTSSPAVDKKPAKKAKHEVPLPTNETAKKGKNRETEYQVVQATLLLSISPVFTTNPRAGVNEMLDSMIMRYIPALEGVVLSHSNLAFLDDKAAIKAECPFLVCRVSFDATVWSPRIGMKLEGRLSVCSPDHISILMHRTFNVSIPRHHIPDEWEFEYGPADNDPEFGPDAVAEEEEGDKVDDDKVNNEEGGRWVHKTTGKPIGGDDHFLSFTAIGLTVANEMLSVIGSLQADPFSGAHSTKPKALDTVEEDEQVDDELEVPPELDGLEESDDEVDTFEALGKSAGVEKKKAPKVTAKEKKKEKKRKAETDGSKSTKKSKRQQES